MESFAHRHKRGAEGSWPGSRAWAFRPSRRQISGSGGGGAYSGPARRRGVADQKHHAAQLRTSRLQPALSAYAGNRLPQSGYAPAARQVEFYSKLIADLDGFPGVEGSALSSSLPPYSGSRDALTVEGRPAPPANSLGDTATETVSPGFFTVMNIPLLQRRQFDVRDRNESLPVAIVSEALANEVFPPRGTSRETN